MVGTISLPFPYMEEEAWVSMPVAANIFKHQGGGQNYVHGGASLAEMLVPLMTVKSRKGRQVTEKATIKLLQPSHRRLNNLITHLEFLQEEAISPRVTPVTYQVYFETADELKISGEELVQADSVAEATAERIIKVRVTLQSRKYDPSIDYYLVIKDSEDPLAQGQRIPFHIDIAFADDFGF